MGDRESIAPQQSECSGRSAKSDCYLQKLLVWRIFRTHFYAAITGWLLRSQGFCCHVSLNSTILSCQLCMNAFSGKRH